MARVVIPNTDRILKYYRAPAEGMNRTRGTQPLETFTNLIGVLDKLSESGVLTTAARGLKKGAEAIGDYVSNAEVVGGSMAPQATPPQGIGGSTMVPPSAKTGVPDVMAGASQEEMRAYAAMTPDQQLKYRAAKAKAAYDAEQASFAAAKGEFEKSKEEFQKTADAAVKEAITVGRESHITKANAERELAKFGGGLSKSNLDESKKKLQELISLQDKAIDNRMSRLKKMEMELSGSPDAVLAQQRDAFIKSIDDMNTEKLKLKDELTKLEVLVGQPLTPQQEKAVDKYAADLKSWADKRMNTVKSQAALEYAKEAPTGERPMVDTNVAPMELSFDAQGKPVFTPAGQTPAATTPPVATKAAATPAVAPSTVTPTTQAKPPEDVYTPPVAPVTDYVSELKAIDQNTKLKPAEKKAMRDALLTKASRELAMRATQAGATPETSSTEVRQTAPAGQAPAYAAERTTVPEADAEMEARYAELQKKYGLDKPSAKKYIALEEMGITPRPDQAAEDVIKTEDQLYSAAKLADTAEKQKLVMDSIKNIELAPKNVFEALGFAGPDPERRIKYTTAVQAMFPKKSAEELYYDRLLKIEKAKAMAAKTTTEDAKRMSDIEKKLADIEKTRAGTVLTEEQAKLAGAKRRTEDYLRGANLAKKISDMDAQAKRAEAALKAASRPRGGSSGMSFQQRLILQQAAALSAKAKSAYEQAGKAERDAAALEGRAPKFSAKDEAELARLEKEAGKAKSAVTKSEKDAAAKATKAYAEKSAQKQKAEAGKAAAEKAKQDAATLRGIGDQHVRDYNDLLTGQGVPAQGKPVTPPAAP